MSEKQNLAPMMILIIVCIVVNFMQGEKIRDLQTRMEEVELNK